MRTVVVSGDGLTVEDVVDVARGEANAELADSVTATMEPSLAVVTTAIRGDAPVYGVNTGFGALADTRVAERDLAQLQSAIIVSHAAAAGDPNIADELKKGKQLGDKNYKVHLDGYDQTDLITGKGPSKRHEIFYFTESTLGATRIDDYKYRFTDQPNGWLGATEKVALGDDTDQAVVPIDDRDPADPAFGEERRQLLHRSVGLDCDYVGRHDVHGTHQTASLVIC